MNVQRDIFDRFHCFVAHEEGARPLIEDIRGINPRGPRLCVEVELLLMFRSGGV
jgi:hypothetical protein